MADQDVAALADRAIGIAEKAQETQGEIVRTQRRIVAQQGRQRHFAYALAVSLVVDIALSVFLIRLDVGQVHVSQAIRRSQFAGCAIGNEFRAGQVRLWDHVIVVSAVPPHETAAQREKRLARLESFRAYVAAQFRPVNCARLYGR